MSENTVLEIAGLNVAYRTDRGSVPSLRDVGVKVAPGEVVGIVGESGSGKSTLAGAILGTLPATASIESARIAIGGVETTTLTASQRRELRRTKLGVITQSPITAMDPTRRVARAFADVGCSRDAAVRHLAEVGLTDPDRVMSAFPHELSGGMAQRVCIALAASRRPALLVADEPTSALDEEVADSVLRTLVALAHDTGAALVIITHDLKIVEKYCQRVVVMSKGVVVESGATENVLRNPTDPYTRALLAATGLRDSAPRRPHTIAANHAIEMRDVSVAFVSGPPWARHRKPALVDVSIAVREGEMLGVVGASGSGKSTVCRVLLGLQRPDSGAVLVDGRPLRSPRRGSKGSVQVVLQHPDWALNPAVRVATSLSEPLHVVRRASRSDARKEVRDMMERLGMDPELADRFPHELSGGQRQRASIARALVAAPRLLVFDEAVSALDVSVQAQVLREIVELQAELGFTGLFVSHDLGAVKYVADRTVQMEAGHVDAITETGVRNADR